MITCLELKKIAQTRLNEAKCLYKAGFYDGAVYLAGYVVEISLKALLCKHLKMDGIPDNNEKHKEVFCTHDFDRLLILSGLTKKINANNKRNNKLFVNWSIVTGWNPSNRYTVSGVSQGEAKLFLKALDDKNYGIFVYIKKIW